MQPTWQSRETLRALGWTDTAVDSALRNGSRVAVARGVLLPITAADTLQQRCGAALATQRKDAAISHRHGALCHGWPWVPTSWQDPTAAVDLTVARDDLTRSARRGLNRKIADLPEDDVIEIDGLRVTSAARTAVDIARTEPRLIAVQLMDWLLTNTSTTAENLRAVTHRMVRVPNVCRARAAIDLARAGVDSPPETTARLQAVSALLPHPDTCLRIEEDGVLLARGDLGYWRSLIWIEYDGWEWHSSRGVFSSDRVRDRWLARRGWECMRLTDKDLRSPRNWLDQLGQAIADAPDRIAAMAPGRSPEVAAAQALLDTSRHR
jgi:hypothetical protein